ncbi:MAG: hypothetical protein N4A47_07280 [Clostridia bacterium]|jgi:phenylpyruvate tautomerase PptA (4-oxalocrotonate tautomerase family)|nr:hypothetical protein [Clostridia bacterium]
MGKVIELFKHKGLIELTEPNNQEIVDEVTKLFNDAIDSNPDGVRKFFEKTSKEAIITFKDSQNQERQMDDFYRDFSNSK